MDLKDICIEIAKKYIIDSIGLFGSRARGDFNEQSDYDIFIIGNIDLNTELRLEYDLEKKLDSEVDVIKINNETDKMFLKNILNEAIVFLIGPVPKQHFIHTELLSQGTPGQWECI